MLRTALVKETFPTEPFGVMRRLSDEMDRMFQGVSMPRAFTAWKDGPWAPRVESFARNGTFVVRAELPGLTEKDVTVELAGNLLTIKGERKQEKEDKQAEYYTSECTYGSFLRTLELPDTVKVDAITATFKDGVLEIAMPQPVAKLPEARKVEVKGG